MPCGIYFRIGVPRMYAAEILRRAAKQHTPSPRAVFHRIHTRPDPVNHTGRCPMTACAAGPSLPAPHTQLGLSPLASQPDGGRRRQVTPRPSTRGARKTRTLFKTAQGPVPGPCGKGWTRLYSTGAPCLYSLHILLAAARRSHVTRQAGGARGEAVCSPPHPAGSSVFCRRALTHASLSARSFSRLRACVRSYPQGCLSARFCPSGVSAAPRLRRAFQLRFRPYIRPLSSIRPQSPARKSLFSRVVLSATHGASGHTQPGALPYHCVACTAKTQNTLQLKNKINS